MKHPFLVRSTLAFLMVSVLQYTAVADTCDPNSDVPLTAFSVRQDMAKAKIHYEIGAYKCAFSDAQSGRMSFEVAMSDYSGYTDDKSQTGFSCTREKYHGREHAPVTGRLLSGLFAGTAVKLENCQYAANAAPKPMEPASSSTFNLQTTEKRTIEGALKDSQGNPSVAAKKLGISEKALGRKMKEYGIVPLRP